MIMTARELERKARQDRRFISKETQTAAKYLRRIEELSGAPEGMEPFLDTLRRIYVAFPSKLNHHIYLLVRLYLI